MLERMKQDEQGRWNETMADMAANYTVTITKRNADTDGEIWLAARQWLEAVLEKDPNAVGIVALSSDRWSHPHAHGVLCTTLSQHQVRGVAKGCKVHTTCVTEQWRWNRYVLNQAARDCVLDTESIKRLKDGGI